MTIQDLILSGLIKDQDTIRVYRKMDDLNMHVVAAGNWYSDRVLEWREAEITAITYINRDKCCWSIDI